MSIIKKAPGTMTREVRLEEPVNELLEDYARFTGERFEGLYRGWKNGRVSEIGIRQEVGTNDRKHSVGFDTFLLQRIGPVADSANSE